MLPLSQGVDALVAFRTKREQLKNDVLRFEKVVSEFNDNKSINELLLRLKKAEELWHHFDNVQTQIEYMDQNSDHARERESFENIYFSVIANAQKLIESFNKNIAPVVKSQVNVNNEVVSLQNKVNLPVIDLPIFRGKYEQWSQFADIFRTIINDSSSLSSIQKFFYLKSCIKDEASQVIQSLEVSEANYEVAWQLLTERYDNKRLMINAHVKAIFDLPFISRESAVGLRKLLDEFLNHFRALQNLGEPVTYWDTLLIHLLSQKIDFISKREWEKLSIKNRENSLKLTDFIDFLKQRCQVLELVQSKSNGESNSDGKYEAKVKKLNDKIMSYVSTENSNKCVLCKDNHYIQNCSDFKKLPTKERYNKIKELRACTNCLRLGHSNPECRGYLCKICNKKHNVMLHFENKGSGKIENVSSGIASNGNMSVSENQVNHNEVATLTAAKVSHKCAENNKVVLLSTAMILIKNGTGEYIKCRALLDAGSQSNFICKELFDKLKLRKSKINIPIVGINKLLTSISTKTEGVIKSMYNAFSKKLTFLVLENITQNVPSFSFDVSNINIPQNITLADPEFNESRKIDILLGSDVFWELLCVGQIKIGETILHKTKLGWVAAGPIIANLAIENKSYCNLSLEQSDVQFDLERFWTIEEVASNNKGYSREEIACENIFANTIKQNETGRFIVTLPMRDTTEGVLGGSFEHAVERFHTLENKFAKNNDFKIKYTRFINEYKNLGHMSQLNNEEVNDASISSFYLPHHGIEKQNSITTKLRVVFDGSAKSSNGKSLNDVLMVGPKIQDELFSIVIRFRKHNFVITAEIQKCTETEQWRHVSGHDNPADLITRGLDTSKLIDNPLWWQGPNWLALNEEHWPTKVKLKSASELPEQRKLILSFTATVSSINPIFKRYSSFSKLVRVVAYCLRFITNSRAIKSRSYSGSLTSKELERSLIVLVKLAQQDEFSRELLELGKLKSLPTTSRLISLNPFVDDDQIIRVGGRLKNAPIAYDKKCPMLIPNKHPFTELIVNYEHLRHIHSGPQLTLAAVRQKFWPLHGLTAVKRCLRTCLACFKQNPGSLKPMMGDLPESRVSVGRPFYNTATDYAGPFYIKDGTNRTRKIIKCYLCLFVCTSTKAVHLELTSGLTTEAFLNAFKRFISRRGICKNIFSDNATNYVGANRKLKEELKGILKFNKDSRVTDFLTRNSITWNFIPARSPHFAGLAEAAVKSAKRHLKIIVGNNHLTFEELSTVTAQVEAILNSRPLTPLSTDPNDTQPLTPGHFLIGDSLTVVPEEDVARANPNRLKKYKLLSQLVQHFWRRWSKEYLVTLQQRSKWRTHPSREIKTGDLVLLRDENMPPAKWPLGRITEVCPGADGIVRVVKIKTATNEFTRAVHKVCCLPAEENEL